LEKIYFCGEEAYLQSSWHEEALNGVIQAAKRRGLDVVILRDSQEAGLDGENVILLGFSASWIARQTAAFQKLGARVMLICMEEDGIPDRVHIVELDRVRAIRDVMGRLHGAGRDRICLFGPDLGSVSDRERVTAFRKAAEESSLPLWEREVYPNVGSLEETYQTIRGELSGYNAALCVNDYLALYLMRRAMADGVWIPDDLMVVGCGNMPLGRMSRPTLTTITLDYLEAGRQAVEALIYLDKHPEIIFSVHTMESRILIGDSTGELPSGHLRSRTVENETGSVRFFEDGAVLDIMGINDFLFSCDPTDRAILRAFLSGKRSSEAADACYISQTTFKKRMSRLLVKSKTASRSELVEFLRRWKVDATLLQ